MRKAMKFKILTIVTILVMMIMIAGMLNVSNAYSVSGGLTSSDKLVANGNVAVTLSFSDIDAASGVMSVTVDKINYDTNIFETITKSNFVGSNGWDISYSTTNQILTLTNDEHIASAGPVVTLNLKVKSGVTAKQATVSFEGIVASEGLTTGDINVGTKSITINAVADAVPAETEPATPENTTNTTTQTTQAQTTMPATSSTTQKTTSTTNNTTTTATTTSAKSGVSTLPKAGIGIGIIITLSVVIIGGVIFYGLYRNLKKYDI